VKIEMYKIDRRAFLKLAGITPLSLALLINSPDATPLSNSLAEFFDPWLEINLNHIAWNLSQIRHLVNPRPVMAVIKANAYGHGLVEVARFLEQQNIRFLAVGKVQEALQLRESGVKTSILNFGPFSNQDVEQLVRLNISQSVYADNVTFLADAAHKLHQKAKVHIKIDTGLGRVGVPYYQALSFIEKVAAMSDIAIEGIFTTFTEDEDFDKIQLERFLQVCDAAKEQGINVGLRHAASSAALLSFPQAHLDMVRPGITIYGHYPSDKEYQARKIDLKPAMTLKTRVMYVKILRPGDSVSYHRKFTAQKETQVATLPIGYSDGYPHQVADRGEVIIWGRRHPIIAAVTANHTTVNVTGANDVKIGDEAVLIGKQEESQITAEEVADWIGTSVYKIVIGMNPLLPRVYFGK
jgi:alanine racemase